MKSYRTLAFKELLAQKMTSFLILAAIILSTAMTTVIGQSAGVLSAMRQQQAIALGGDRYATFVQMNEEQTEALQNDPRLSYTGVSVSLGTVELSRALHLDLIEFRDGSGEIFPSFPRLREGRLPERAMEIALPEDALRLMGVEGKVGDTITLTAAKTLRHGVETEELTYQANFILTGITESNYMGYAAGIICGIVGEGTAEQVLPDSYIYYLVDIRTSEKGAFQDTMDDLVSRLHVHELDTIYNVTYLRALGIPYDEEAADTEVSDQGFPFLTAAGLLAGTLVLLAAGLVIYNILKIAVSKRIRQFGTLRAMGGEKGQLYAIVTTEVLLLCIGGIPAGMLLGMLSAEGILSAAAGMLSPDIFLVNDTAQLKRLIAENSGGKGLFLALSAVITLGFALIAALPAARSAANVPPVVAISHTDTRVRRRGRKVKRIRSFEAYYARLNLKRNRGRTAITILSLVMSITVFIALQSFVSLLNTAGSLEEAHLGDYSVINETVGFTPEILEELEQNENVEAAAALQLSIYLQNDENRIEEMALDFSLQPGETFQVAGLSGLYMDKFFKAQLTKEQLEALKAGEGCVIRNPVPFAYDGKQVPRTGIRAGETIHAGGKEIPVLYVLDDYGGYISIGSSGFVNGVQMIVNNGLYTELTGKSVYEEILPVLKKDADRKAFDTTLEELSRRIPGTSCLSFEQTDKQLEESFAQIKMLAWGLILFIGLIGLLNIVNTVYTNIHTRINEIGTQRAIGMSVGSLYRTFLWEGVYYGLIAAILGCAAGYLCTVFVQAAAQEELSLAPLPFLPMVQATALSITACLAATCIPLRKIAGMSIVGAIENLE